MRQTNIEIFADCSQERLLAWVESVIGGLSTGEVAGAATIYQSSAGSVITTPIEDSDFISIWFSTPHSPWATDVDCARQAAREIRCVVRCDPGVAYDVDPYSDVFLQIADSSETLIDWW